MKDKTILEVVHEGAKDLHDAGLMNDVTMREFDALCLPQIYRDADQTHQNSKQG